MHTVTMAVVLSAMALAGCASRKYIPPEIRYDEATPAVRKV
ncbi:MAG: P-type conjugative transfer protein TrbG, partial [Mesorhizobium sp.]